MPEYKKRRAITPEKEFGADDDEIEEYVPLKQRKQARLAKLKNEILKEDHDQEIARKEQEVLELEREKKKAAEAHKKRTLQGSLLAQSAALREEEARNAGKNEKKKLEDLVQQEQRLLEQVQLQLSAPLVSAKEHAKGVKFTQRMLPIGEWDMIPRYKNMTQDEADKMREQFFIETNGDDVPPPHKHFRDMRLPQGVLDGLKAKNILRPTQIQMQGIPALLQGRDMIGIAFTGSGKTLVFEEINFSEGFRFVIIFFSKVFSLPLVMRAAEQEAKLPVQRGEGPFGVVMAPSRELASQTNEIIQHFADHLVQRSQTVKYLKSVLLIGGMNGRGQMQEVRNGCHMVVATPGRLNDFLNKKIVSLAQCSYLALDEADRMIDLGFEDEIRSLLDGFKGQRQSLLFSATMPLKIQEFAKSALFDPIVVNVGRAGAANLDVVQEVEYVKQEAKLPYLLQCLQKTAPPVLVFCENKSDVDDCQEYLLLKGVEACSIHGGLSQEERHESIQGYKTGRKDVLIGTDVASKGLDFPAIQHVINYDMPKEIENYIHRIGRTGRCGRTGVATTFVNKNQEETILLDLRAVLSEAKQKIPPFLASLESPFGHTVKELGGIKGCAFCGGLGHRIAQCPKLEANQMKAAGAGKDYMVSGSRYGGDAGYGGDW